MYAAYFGKLKRVPVDDFELRRIVQAALQVAQFVAQLCQRVTPDQW